MQTGILAETHAMYFCVDAERWNDAHHEIEELIQRQVQVPTDCVCVCVPFKISRIINGHMNYNLNTFTWEKARLS